MSSLRRLNPRLHLAAAIGWAVFAVVTLAGLVAANVAAAQAEKRALADAEGLLAELATQVRDALSMNLETRRSVLQATAAQVVASSSADPGDVGRILTALQVQFPEFAWLGTADRTGTLKAATGDLLVGADVASMPWFQQGRQRPFVSEGHASPRTVPTAPGTQDEAFARLLDLAVPLDQARVPDGGVVAAFVHWSWVEQVLSKMQDALNKRRQVELMLAGRDGTVLVGPSDWLGVRPTLAHDLSEGGRYSIGTRTQLRLADGLGLGWTAIVRQRADVALEPVRAIRRTVFMIVFLAGLLSAACAAMVARVFTRRLSSLAQDAEAVRSGTAPAITPPMGSDEVSRIGATLAELVRHLQTEKQALLALNSELDMRVADRTLRIERMADESRHAAVTRERLRIARDLHDTLAHSMMALLTQIRLVRKLRTRMAPEELDAELARAEAVAATGLTEARAAITQMRDNGVHDTGLGPALADLVKRFGHRTGIAVTLALEPRTASWADDRAETVFRIIEESLRNVERHAQARTVQISMRRDDAGRSAESGTGVVIEVVDDGVGFDPNEPTPGHYGMRGMREQAALIAARWEIHSERGQGTRMVLRLQAAAD